MSRYLQLAWWQFLSWSPPLRAFSITGTDNSSPQPGPFPRSPLTETSSKSVCRVMLSAMLAASARRRSVSLKTAMWTRGGKLTALTLRNQLSIRHVRALAFVFVWQCWSEIRHVPSQTAPTATCKRRLRSLRPCWCKPRCVYSLSTQKSALLTSSVPWTSDVHGQRHDDRANGQMIGPAVGST